MSLGCIVGLIILITPIALAYWHLSIWWLLISSFLASVFNVTSYNVRARLLQQAEEDGRIGRAFFYAYILPAVFNFVPQAAIYGVAKWLLP
jgi:uncharacterized membrane protein